MSASAWDRAVEASVAARHASIKAEGLRCALGTVQGFAAEVTQ